MWRELAMDLPGWPQLVRRLLASMASLLIVVAVVPAWCTQRRHKGILVVATVVGLLFLVEITLGALMLVVDVTIFYVGHLCSNSSRAVGYDGGSRGDGWIGIGIFTQWQRVTRRRGSSDPISLFSPQPQPAL